MSSGFLRVSAALIALGAASAACAPVQTYSGFSAERNNVEIPDPQVGVDTRANDQTLTVERSFVEDFDRRRLEVSGVNLDEEVTFLIQFQRAFEASARVITVADRMLETLLNVAL